MPTNSSHSEYEHIQYMSPVMRELRLLNDIAISLLTGLACYSKEGSSMTTGIAVLTAVAVTEFGLNPLAWWVAGEVGQKKD